MNPVTTDQILKNALKQPEAERARIAEALIASLEDTPSAKVEEAWQKEMAKRLREIDSGAVECIPWEEVRERLRRNTHARD
jgi:putative addiction module component (TIGR02574 family)